jgi:hypothetical protein
MTRLSIVSGLKKWPLVLEQPLIKYKRSLQGFKRTATRRRLRLMVIVLSESGNNVDVRLKPYPTGLSSGSTLGVASMDVGKGRELGAVSLIVF